MIKLFPTLLRTTFLMYTVYKYTKISGDQSCSIWWLQNVPKHKLQSRHHPHVSLHSALYTYMHTNEAKLIQNGKRK